MSRKSDSATYRALRDTSKKIKDQIYVDDASPDRNVGEAWSLKHTNIPCIQLPHQDSSPVSAFVEYKDAKKVLDLTNQRLAKKRKNLDRRAAYINYQWKYLAQREEALKEEFRKFNKFLRANMEKRERAYKKFASDREMYLKRSADVSLIKRRCESQKANLSNMQTEITKLKKYEDFLQEVAEASHGEFKDASEILPRVEVLLNAKEAIRIRQEKELECLEDSVGYTVKFVGSKMIDVLNKTGSLPILKIKYDETQNRRLELEYLLVNLKALLSSLLSDLLVNVNAIDVIYNQMRLRRQFHEDTRNKDRFYKVMMIGRTLKEFKAMRKTVNVKQKKKRSTSVSEKHTVLL